MERQIDKEVIIYDLEEISDTSLFNQTLETHSIRSNASVVSEQTITTENEEMKPAIFHININSNIQLDHVSET